VRGATIKIQTYLSQVRIVAFACDAASNCLRCVQLGCTKHSGECRTSQPPSGATTVNVGHNSLDTGTHGVCCLGEKAQRSHLCVRMRERGEGLRPRRRERQHLWCVRARNAARWRWVGRGWLGVKSSSGTMVHRQRVVQHTSTMNSAKRVGMHVTMLPNLQSQLRYCSEARA
jgi:hypothetical protein